MIDSEGFRPNVGIIIINKFQEVFWAGRIGQAEAWQFPQGGIDENETPEQALFRELYEEVGLKKDDVKILAVSQQWLTYRLPKKYRRYDQKPLCIGQKQKWFLLELCAEEAKINFNAGADPEFDRWCWINYWEPIKQAISFKRKVYENALNEFKPIIFGHD
jgi:putative (di)nucleoside polyphosphate hydrolase